MANASASPERAHGPEEEPGAGGASHDEPQGAQLQSGMDELRRLIVGPEQHQLQDLQDRLDNVERHAKDISRALPDALGLVSGDPTVSAALAPAVEEAMTASVRANPQTMADALFPVMGPAIRKSLSATLAAMLEGLNRALEHSLSPRSLRWRWEAWRTGRPFAEIVLANTVVYRVEQVFLIHRQTGLLLAHVATEEAVVQDADMVSGMLSAIRDFVQDSFAAGDARSAGASLEQFRVGEWNVLVEPGPGALIAGVIRGTPLEETRAHLQETLEAIHLRFHQALAAFQGDAAPFVGTQNYLEACLKSQYREKEKATSPALVGAIAVIVVLLSWWGISAFRESRRWNDYLARLAAEEGLVVVSTDTRWGSHYLVGLRDPLARDPLEILSQTDLNPTHVQARWEPYQALQPKFIEARAKAILQPPPGGVLSYHSGILYVTGPVDASWIAENARLAKAIPGVSVLRRGESLEAALDRLKPEIEGIRLSFASDSPKPADEEAPRLQKLIDQLEELSQAGAKGNRGLHLEIDGHADSSGSSDYNRQLSQARADRVRDLIQAAKIPRLEIAAIGRGANETLAPGARKRASPDDRHVTFKIGVIGSATQ
jgi:outer membrane protein OmpA-like peptidoglycan-associated protein